MLAAVFSAVGIPAQCALAQARDVGDIVGVVREASGRPVPGAEVRAIPSNRLARSDSLGRFHIESLTPQRYELRVRCQGFRAETLSVSVTSGRTVSVEIAIRRADSVRLSTVVVSGTRLSEADAHAPARVEALPLVQAISAPGAVVAALSDMTGVILFDDQGAILQPELQVRGFTVSPVVGTPQGVSVFLDGVRVNEPDAQEVNFDLLPMAAVDRSALVRGPGVLFGRNSLGGTLLLTTRRGSEDTPAELEVGGGSLGERSATFTGGGKLGGVDGFIAATGLNETGWRTATSASTRSVFGTLGRQWADSRDSGDVALSVQYAHDKIREAGSLPSDYAAANPRFNYTPDFFSPELLGLTLRGSQALGGGVLRATAFARRNVFEQFNGNIPPPNTDGFVRNLSSGSTVEWTRLFDLARRRLGVTAGLEYERDAVDFRLIAVESGLPDSVTTRARVRQDNAGAFSQATVALTSALTVTAGVRADYVRIPFRDQLDASNDGTSTFSRVSPGLGVSYQFSNALRWYLAYKTGFRAPAPLELACASPSAPCSLPSALGADPPLAPVTSNDYEAGLDLTFAGSAHLSVDAFRTDVDHDIQLAAPNLTEVYFINVPRTRRAGVELSGEAALPLGTRLFASYAYVAATFQSTVQIATADSNPQQTRPGDVFPTSPLHRARAGAGASQLLRGIALNGEIDLRGYSSQYLRGDESNQRPPVPGYALAGVRGDAAYGRYAAHLEVQNLFDRRYSSFGVEAQDFLGPYGGKAGTNAPVTPFLTPGLPRRVSLSLSVIM